MEFSFESLVNLGIDMKTGIDFTGGKDKYLSALQRYYKSSEGNKAKIKEYIESDNLNDFCITVHALKSNSKMIGAANLSKKFETLEAASKNNDLLFCKEFIKPTLEEYNTLLEVLKPLGEMQAYKAEGEISGDEAKETAEKLLAALDDFDDELAVELAKKLMGYPFRITQKGKLREALDKIEEFMYDEAADLINEIIPAIE